MSSTAPSCVTTGKVITASGESSDVQGSDLQSASNLIEPFRVTHNNAGEGVITVTVSGCGHDKMLTIDQWESLNRLVIKHLGTTLGDIVKHNVDKEKMAPIIWDLLDFAPATEKRDGYVESDVFGDAVAFFFTT